MNKKTIATGFVTAMVMGSLLFTSSALAFWPFDGLFNKGEVMGESTDEAGGISLEEQKKISANPNYTTGRLIPFSLSKYVTGINSSVTSTSTLFNRYNTSSKYLATGKDSLGKKLTDAKLDEILKLNKQRLTQIYSAQMKIEEWTTAAKQNVIFKMIDAKRTTFSWAKSPASPTRNEKLVELQKLADDASLARQKTIEAENKVFQYMAKIDFEFEKGGYIGIPENPKFPSKKIKIER